MPKTFNRGHVLAIYRRLWGPGSVALVRTTSIGTAPSLWQVYRPDDEGPDPMVSATSLGLLCEAMLHARHAQDIGMGERGQG